MLDIGREARHEEGKTMVTPHYEMRIEVADEEDEVLRNYAVEMIRSTVLAYAKNGMLDEITAENPPSDKWAQYDWDVPSDVIERQVRDCLADLDTEEIRQLLSIAMTAAAKAVLRMDRVQLDYYLASSNFLLHFVADEGGIDWAHEMLG